MVNCLPNYEKVNAFYLHNGEALSANALPKDAESEYVVRWKIYQFVTVHFGVFEDDSSVIVALDGDSETHTFGVIDATEESYEIRVAGILPGTYSLVLRGAESGHVAKMDHIVIDPPAPIKFF